MMNKEKFDAMLTTVRPVIIELSETDYKDLLTDLTSAQFAKENREQLPHFFYQGVKITTNRSDIGLSKYLEGQKRQLIPLHRV